jgi:hypothetical protein
MNGSVVVDSLESINASDYFTAQRHRWNTNEEIAAILIAIDKHDEWLSKEVKIRSKLFFLLINHLIIDLPTIQLRIGFNSEQ